MIYAKQIIMFILSKFGMTESAAASGQRPSYIYIKRVMFVFLAVLVVWGLVDPESLVTRLERAEEIMPGWFINILSSFFTGVLL